MRFCAHPRLLEQNKKERQEERSKEVEMFRILGAETAWKELLKGKTEMLATVDMNTFMNAKTMPLDDFKNGVDEDGATILFVAFSEEAKESTIEDGLEYTLKSTTYEEVVEKLEKYMNGDEDGEDIVFEYRNVFDFSQYCFTAYKIKEFNFMFLEAIKKNEGKKTRTYFVLSKKERVLII